MRALADVALAYREAAVASKVPLTHFTTATLWSVWEPPTRRDVFSPRER